MPAARRIADTIARNSPTAVQSVKRAVQLGEGQPIEQAIAISDGRPLALGGAPRPRRGDRSLQRRPRPDLRRRRFQRARRARVDDYPRGTLTMTVAEDLGVGTGGAGDDQSSSLQRRGTAPSPGRGHHAHRAPLRAQQLRAARARRHGGDRWRRRHPQDPHPRRPPRCCPSNHEAVTLECAGNGRLDMRPLPTGEPWGDFPRLHRALERRPPQPGPGGRRPPPPASTSVEGADHGPYHLQAILPETDQDNLSFVRALPLAEAADPSSAS